ncbi:thiolase C-terminal domain-containing protein [Paracraurococcus ruber]|uniref:Acetyl-CoA acetyltransferase n=1 Tax=Paracraurococcus ruber TaxID=77675 RepID=A0ABS1CST6_9PROT|nr:acetyl-CoA acetyltransferase [Paracraurococcus ruber]MBK1657429.1 acetyl-CoA acetyltransferase [Paracraurococcus ruber]TDG33859.1 acetyl-CoA acetyltransferase [Paracraurococcus ruber]
MSERTLRGKVAIAGIGETTYYRHGQSPDAEFKLALIAILEACRDAGIDPREVDGFASYGGDRSEAVRLAAALGIHELRFSNMHWGGGGGGVAASVANAAAAVQSGMANCVIAFRSLAQGQFARYGRANQLASVGGDDAFLAPYGLMSPAQRFAMKITRFMTDHGIRHEALRAIAMASYHHAQTNPRAVMNGRPLTEEKYDASRWIIEPFHRLFDCCQENDGAGAVLVVPADRAKDLPHRPTYLLGAAQGGHHRSAAPVHNAPDYASAHFKTVARNLWDMAKLGPQDCDVVQAYENFTGGVLLSLVEHGFVDPGRANEQLVLDNLLAPTGRMPMNTSGGNLAECYMHGLEMVNEAVRQLRGTACNQVPGADVVAVLGGPMVTPVSSLVLGSEASL